MMSTSGKKSQQHPLPPRRQLDRPVHLKDRNSNSPGSSNTHDRRPFHVNAEVRAPGITARVYKRDNLLGDDIETFNSV